MIWNDIKTNDNNIMICLFQYQFQSTNLTFTQLGITLFVLCIPFFMPNTPIADVEAHKLLESPHDGNTGFDSALTIPNHTVSWAIYQQLGGEGDVKARFFKFDNKESNSSFYAHISIPKIETYLNFTPSLALIGPFVKSNSSDTFTQLVDPVNINQANNNNISLPFDLPRGYQMLTESDYHGKIPSPTFYEPFTQTSYWERQEIKTQLHNVGTHYVVVFNNNNNNDDGDTVDSSVISNNGLKFSLAVGDLEDFSLQDFFTTLPYSWIKVKLFFNDYLSILAALVVVISVVMTIMLAMILTVRKKKKLTN
jgi:hypothetical protein